VFKSGLLEDQILTGLKFS